MMSELMPNLYFWMLVMDKDEVSPQEQADFFWHFKDHGLSQALMKDLRLKIRCYLLIIIGEYQAFLLFLKRFSCLFLSKESY